MDRPSCLTDIPQNGPSGRVMLRMSLLGRSIMALLLPLLAPAIPTFAQTTLTPATLAFGNQAVAVASASKTATFKNTQAVAMTIDSIAISGGTAPGDYASTTTCPISPSTLDAGASLFYLFNLLEGRSILK